MRKIKNPPSNVIISRTDSIGDVVLTLPVAAALKKKFPEMKIGFMGNAYTKSVIEACEYVDMFIDVEDFLNDIILVCNEIPKAIIHVLPVKVIAKRAKELKIPIRIGTRNRIYHWATCNYLVELSRKKSILHESQLNLKLLKPFGLTQNLSTEELWQFFGLTKIKPLDQRLASLIDDKKYNLIIHPKSRGNGREWGLVNFIKLVRLLDKNKFKIFISGLEKEKIALNPLFNEVGESVTNITGIMNLSEFMSFIANCNGLVASGTGPVHLAAALGIGIAL